MAKSLWYLLDRRLGGLQSQSEYSGKGKKVHSPPLPGMGTVTVLRFVLEVVDIVFLFAWPIYTVKHSYY
jgi:hypothetical protein